MSRAVTSSSTQIYASGQENYSFAVAFDTASEGLFSHTYQVDNNFVRFQAFGLADGETVTIQQVTGQGQGDFFADYCPVNGPIQLTNMRNSYIVERPGRYRLQLRGELGSVRVTGFRFAMENEASQDIVDALFAVLTQLKINIVQGPGISVTLGGTTYTISNTGVITASPTATTTPTIIAGNLTEDVNLSAVVGNLLQINPDGLYYGIMPPLQFLNQYVSSSTGNDNNAGTIASPYKTIQKALSNLPDETIGNIYLYAGDTFHTYPTAGGDVINAFTYVQSLALILNIANRKISFLPYNDPAIDAINAYNAANGTSFDPYVAAEINFPIIQITLSLPTDITTTYIPVAFSLDLTGSLSFSGINFVVGQTGTLNPDYIFGAIFGSINVSFQGGNIILGSVPVIGGSGTGSVTDVGLGFTFIKDHVVPSTPPIFCRPISRYFYQTNPVFGPGVPIVGALPYTYQEDNAESYLTTAALWPSIVIYSTAFRSFRNVITSIAIA